MLANGEYGSVREEVPPTAIDDGTRMSDVLKPISCTELLITVETVAESMVLDRVRLGENMLDRSDSEVSVVLASAEDE